MSHYEIRSFTMYRSQLEHAYIDAFEGSYVYVYTYKEFVCICLHRKKEEEEVDGCIVGGLSSAGRKGGDD